MNSVRENNNLTRSMYVAQRPIQDSKVHVAHMGLTRVLSVPGGPHVGPMNLAIRDVVPGGKLA